MISNPLVNLIMVFRSNIIDTISKIICSVLVYLISDNFIRLLLKLTIVNKGLARKACIVQAGAIVVT